MKAPATGAPGRVVARHGRRYRVELAGGGELDCIARGRNSDIACGDRVRVAPAAGGTGVIETVEPRSSLLYRSAAHRDKLIAANATQAVIVVAPAPAPATDLVDRCLAAAEHAGLASLIVLNKADLPQSARVEAMLEPYRALGCRVLTLSAQRDVAPLRAALHGHASVLVGQSGVGKSTIVNALVPGAGARTAEVSAALGPGRHTTTHSRLYRLDAASCIIDSPGLQVFGLHHLDARDAARAFVEFRPWLGRCRFRDCRHAGEPGCAVADACARGEIAASRLASYRRILAELEAGARARGAAR